MKRAISAAVLAILIPATCLADAPSRVRSRSMVAPAPAAEAAAPAGLAAATSRVLKVFKVFGDDEGEGGTPPRKAARRSRKGKAAKRPVTRKPRLAPAPSAEPAGILDLIDQCPESMKM
jgi:hypothetical protein